MTDRYQRLVRSGPGKFLATRLGLPRPAQLRRFESGGTPLTGPALIGSVLSNSAKGGRLIETVRSVAAATGIDVLETRPESGPGESGPGESGPGESSTGAAKAPRYGGLVFDATGIVDARGLRELYDFFHPVVRSLGFCGRVVVLGTPPETTTDPRELIAQRALEGFTRSLGKELQHGSTIQLVYVAQGAEPFAASTLQFLLSPRSAYVSGQVIRVGTHGTGKPGEPEDWQTPLAGKVALVTGAARGIGEAIAGVLARDGAHVVALDVPQQQADLAAVATRTGGSSLLLDITADSAPQELVDHLRQHHGGVDIVVHNAGITRDKKLANMSDKHWDAVIAVNLASQLEINSALLGSGALNTGGRIIGVSSIAGIAGNTGQTNYGTTKAGVIGMVNAYAPVLAERGATINAVAPGFIETAMTAAVPRVVKEAGRRMNSLSQGGLPVDVAETIAWYANPASHAVSGNIVRVCGQSLLGA